MLKEASWTVALTPPPMSAPPRTTSLSICRRRVTRTKPTLQLQKIACLTNARGFIYNWQGSHIHPGRYQSYGVLDFVLLLNV